MAECVKKQCASFADAGFDDLSVHVLQHVLYYLVAPDNCNAAKTCKAFYAAYKLPGLWRLDKSLSFACSNKTLKAEFPTAAYIQKAYLKENTVENVDGWLNKVVIDRVSVIPADLAAAWCGVLNTKSAATLDIYGLMTFVRHYSLGGHDHIDWISIYFYA